MAVLPGRRGDAARITLPILFSSKAIQQDSPVSFAFIRRPVGRRTLKKLSRVVQVVSPHPLPKRVPVRGAVFLVFNADIPPVS